MGNRSLFYKQLGAASANNIALSQGPVTGGTAVTLNGAAATAGVATIDSATANNTALGRRVLITSAGNDTGINFTVTGTNSFGNTITDTFAGGNPTAQSNLDFVTVTSIVPSGTTASTITAGTNTVGSSPWWTANPGGYSPENIGVAVELVSGAVNFTVQYTYDDPNNLDTGLAFPLPFNMAQITGQAATIDAAFTTPLFAARLLINSGVGVVRTRFLQASFA